MTEGRGNAMGSRAVLAALLVAASLGADQGTKLWAESALAPSCGPGEGTGAAPPSLRRCHRTRARIELPAPASRLTWSDHRGVRFSVACPNDAPCLRGGVALDALPEGAESAGEQRLDFGPQLVTIVAGGAASALRFEYLAGRAVEVVRGFVDLRYVENVGASFDLLADAAHGRAILIAFSAIAIALCAWLLARLRPEQRAETAGLALVLSGALGNLVDRARLGYVIDFLELHAGERWRWPTFNVADVAIVAGVALLLWASARSLWKQKRGAQS